MIDKIPEYLVPIYALVVDQDPTAKRLFLAETIGRIYEFKSTKEFFQKQTSDFMNFD